MADITLAGNANWSTCNGGNPPDAADNIYLNTHTLNMDGANGSTYTCAKIEASNGAGTPTAGLITLANATSTITANITAGTSARMIDISGKILTINGTVTGGTGSNAVAIDAISTSANITITGNLIGGSGSGANGLHVVGGFTYTVNLTGCTCTGGSGSNACGVAIDSSATASFTVAGAVGGSASGAAGVCINASGATVTCTSIKGGSNAAAPGLFVLQGKGVVNGCDITGTAIAFSRYPAGVIWWAAGVSISQHDQAGAKKTYIDPTTEAARNTDPGVANVKDGETYSILGVSLEGELVATSRGHVIGG